MIDPFNQSLEVKSTKWTMKLALDLVRALQNLAKDYNYHICLGGSVLNNGESDHDLDLYFIPLGQGREEKHMELMTWLASMLGPGKIIPPQNPNGYATGVIVKYDIYGSVIPPEQVYRYQMEFKYDGLKIDVFVV